MNFRKSRAQSRRNSTNFVAESSEKWRTYSKRLSRQVANVLEEDSEDEEPRQRVINDWAEEFFGRRSEGPEVTDQDIEVQLSKKQTLILSTLVPDEILLMDK